MHIWDISQPPSRPSAPLPGRCVDIQKQPRRENSCEEVDYSIPADDADDDVLEHGRETYADMAFSSVDGAPESLVVSGCNEVEYSTAADDTGDDTGNGILQHRRKGCVSMSFSHVGGASESFIVNHCKCLPFT